jgi:hypothetical protein
MTHPESRATQARSRSNTEQGQDALGPASVDQKAHTSEPPAPSSEANEQPQPFVPPQSPDAVPAPERVPAKPEAIDKDFTPEAGTQTADKI